MRFSQSWFASFLCLTNSNSVLHFCPLIPKNVRRLLYEMEAHLLVWEWGITITKIPWFSELLLEKKDIIINIALYFYFDIPSDLDFIFIWLLWFFFLSVLKYLRLLQAQIFLVSRWPQLLLSPAGTKISNIYLAHISSGLLNVVREVGFPNQEYGVLSLPLLLCSGGSSILFWVRSGDWADTSHVPCTCCSGIWLPTLLHRFSAKLCLPCRAWQGLEWAISFTSPLPVTILNLLTHVPINYWYNDALFRLVSADGYIITRQTFARQADR